MCGIAGCAVSWARSPEPALEGVPRMLHHMRRRGPDAEGVWSGPGVVLGHRRLAIIDLAARSNQPLHRRHTLLDRLQRRDLPDFSPVCATRLNTRVFHFNTTSDTEVLLALYAKEGPRNAHTPAWHVCPGDLGFPRPWSSFSLAIRTGSSLSTTSQTAAGLVLASQVKALLASGVGSGCTRARWLWPGSICGAASRSRGRLYRDVLALPAGHWLRVRDGVAMTPVCWHDIRAHWQGGGGGVVPARDRRKRS